MFNEKSKQLVSVLLLKCHCLCTSENPHCAAESAGYQKLCHGYNFQEYYTPLICTVVIGHAHLLFFFLKVNLYLFLMLYLSGQTKVVLLL